VGGRLKTGNDHHPELSQNIAHGAGNVGCGHLVVVFALVVPALLHIGYPAANHGEILPKA
jgi:hypothetical protein